MSSSVVAAGLQEHIVIYLCIGKGGASALIPDHSYSSGPFEIAANMNKKCSF